MRLGTPARKARQTLGQIFLMPAILGVLSASGLIFALVEDGIWDALSWMALTLPIVLFATCVVRGRQEGRRA